MRYSAKPLIINLTEKAESRKLLEGKPQTFGMRSGKVYLSSGESCGQHSTKAHEEILIFLSGQGILSIDEQNTYPVGKGKVAYIPPHTLHDVRNTSDEPLVYVYCVTPISEESSK